MTIRLFFGYDDSAIRQYIPYYERPLVGLERPNCIRGVESIASIASRLRSESHFTRSGRSDAGFFVSEWNKSVYMASGQ